MEMISLKQKLQLSTKNILVTANEKQSKAKQNKIKEQTVLQTDLKVSREETI